MALTVEQQRAIALARAKQAAAQGQPVSVDPATNQPPGVPTFVPPGVSGYDPQSGTVTPQYSAPGSAAMGAADTTTLGFGDELASLLGSTLTGVPRKQVLTEMRGDANAAQSQNPGSYLTGQIGGGLAQALATGGGGLGTLAAKSGAGLGKIAGGSAIDGALYGGAYGAGSSNGDVADRAKGAGLGAGLGLGTGFAAPLLAAGATTALRKAITPFATSPERVAATDVLRSEGIPLSAGQKTGSKALQYAESELGGSKSAGLMEQQSEAFTNAAMQRAGGSGRATSDNLAKLQDQLGQRFNAISARNSVRVDKALVDDMNAARKEYLRVLPTEQKQIFTNLGDDIASRFKAGKGKMSGEDYQTIRSRLTRMASNSRQGDPEFSGAIRGLRDALDDGMERSIKPQDAGAWKELRRRYGNLKVLERAATGGGADSGLGLISPAQLRMAAASGNRGAYARGQGDFAELAKAGQAVMTPLPNSGTAARTAVRSVGIPAAASGAGGLVAGIPGMIAGAAVPYAVGRGLMSAPVQRYLGNQAIAGPANQVSNALLAALLRNGGIPALSGN